jgi:hypothetical protein
LRRSLRAACWGLTTKRSIVRAQRTWHAVASWWLVDSSRWRPRRRAWSRMPAPWRPSLAVCAPWGGCVAPVCVRFVGRVRGASVCAPWVGGWMRGFWCQMAGLAQPHIACRGMHGRQSSGASTHHSMSAKGESALGCSLLPIAQVGKPSRRHACLLAGADWNMPLCACHSCCVVVVGKFRD